MALAGRGSQWPVISNLLVPETHSFSRLSSQLHSLKLVFNKMSAYPIDPSVHSCAESIFDHTLAAIYREFCAPGETVEEKMRESMRIPDPGRVN